MKPRTSTIDEFDQDAYLDDGSPNPNIIRYGNETYYKTHDGRLVKINPKALNVRREVDQLGPHDAYISKYDAAGKFKHDSSAARRNPHKKNQQVYFADELPYNGNESLASIDNVRIPSGVVTIVRNSNGDLVYYDAKGNIINVKSPNSKQNRQKNQSRTKLNDTNYSMDGTTFMDSGYNTTINNASQMRSQRQTPISNLHPLYSDPSNSDIAHDDTHFASTSQYYDPNRQYTNLNVNNAHFNRANISTEPVSYIGNRYTNDTPLYSQSVLTPQQQQQQQQQQHQTLYTPSSVVNQQYPLNVIDQNTITNGFVATPYLKHKQKLILQQQQQQQQQAQTNLYKSIPNQVNMINGKPVQNIKTTTPVSTLANNNNPSIQSVK